MLDISFQQVKFYENNYKSSSVKLLSSEQTDKQTQIYVRTYASIDSKCITQNVTVESITQRWKYSKVLFSFLN